MAINVELISKEMIKPSSPTPPHLGRYKLSYLDQIVPQTLRIKIIIFYGVKEYLNNAQKSLALKTALGETLTHFYTLAGRMDDNNVVDCNDEGVEYSEGRVYCNMSDVLEKPQNDHVFDKLIPGGNTLYCDKSLKGEPFLAIQFNTFDCGGVAIAIAFVHKIFDGESFNMFLDMWSLAAQRGGDTTTRMTKHPNFNAATLFPPSSVIPNENVIPMEANTMPKRFVFGESSIHALKKAATSGGVQNPSRIEVVSAFIWRRLMAISQSRSRGQRKKYFLAFQAVSIRDRIASPLLDTFGNLVVVPFASSCEGETEENHHALLVKKLRAAARAVDSNYVERVVSTLGDSTNFDNETKALVQEAINGTIEMELFRFSSWGNFIVNEIDFGWGKPFSFTVTTLPYKNAIVLTKTNDGNGIEVFMTLSKDDMDAFDRDPEFLSLINVSDD